MFGVSRWCPLFRDCCMLCPCCGAVGVLRAWFQEAALAVGCEVVPGFVTLPTLASWLGVGVAGGCDYFHRMHHLYR